MSKQNYLSFLDRPEITSFLFYPRKDPSSRPPEGALDLMVPVEEHVSVGMRCYLADPESPHILFFHGNGEIASDYDDIGPVYNSFGLNLMVADYRGYGKSNGEPCVSSLLRDSCAVLKYTRQWKIRNDRISPLWVMGRSLGSAAALEIADSLPGEFDGLVIESGFADTKDLLSRLGINSPVFEDQEDSDISNLDKISGWSKPTLVIHAENDSIIPLEHGKRLYEACPAEIKDMRIISGADHNTIFLIAGRSYFETIRQFIDRI